MPKIRLIYVLEQDHVKGKYLTRCDLYWRKAGVDLDQGHFHTDTGLVQIRTSPFYDERLQSPHAMEKWDQKTWYEQLPEPAL